MGLHILERNGVDTFTEIHKSFDDLVFLNDYEGYLLGRRSGDVSWNGDGSANRIDTAIIYSTKDEGRNWKPIFLEQGGHSLKPVLSMAMYMH